MSLGVTVDVRMVYLKLSTVHTVCCLTLLLSIRHLESHRDYMTTSGTLLTPVVAAATADMVPATELKVARALWNKSI